MSARLNPSLQFLIRTLGIYLFLCSSPIENVAERRVANMEDGVEAELGEQQRKRKSSPGPGNEDGVAILSAAAGDDTQWLTECAPYAKGCRRQTGFSPSLMLFSKRLTPAPSLVIPLETTIQGQRPQFSIRKGGMRRQQCGKTLWSNSVEQYC